MAAGVLVFLWNAIKALRFGPPAGDNPWDAFTLEWATTSPPPEGNFAELPQIHGDPFDRILVAQALVEDLDLVTGDETLRRYPVRTLW